MLLLDAWNRRNVLLLLTSSSSMLKTEFWDSSHSTIQELDLPFPSHQNNAQNIQSSSSFTMANIVPDDDNEIFKFHSLNSIKEKKQYHPQQLQQQRRRRSVLLILGGYLLPASTYQPYVDALLNDYYHHTSISSSEGHDMEMDMDIDIEMEANNSVETYVLAYNDPRIRLASTADDAAGTIPPIPWDLILGQEIIMNAPTPIHVDLLLIGHSKGARTIAQWMPKLLNPPSIQGQQYNDNNNNNNFCTISPKVVLIEPVDVNPPSNSFSTTSTTASESFHPSPYSVLREEWRVPTATTATTTTTNTPSVSIINHQKKTIASIPTLIIAAPYTDTSRRYGKATNLCAPIGKDAQAFYDGARYIRDSLQQQQQYAAGDNKKATTNEAAAVAPLTFVSFDGLGHNDVLVVTGHQDQNIIGGCANGPDRYHRSELVTSTILEWLQSQRKKY